MGSVDNEAMRVNYKVESHPVHLKDVGDLHHM